MDSKNSKKSSKEYEKVVHFRNPIDFKGFFKKRGFVVGAVLVIAVFFLVQNCTYSVKEQEQAIVTMFGNVVRTDTAGLYFKIPFLQQVHMVDMTTHGFGIGYVIENGQNITVEDEGVMITSDFNFIDIDFYVEYKVSDPIAAYFNSEDPYAVMKNIALANIRNTVVKYTVDDVMTTAKGKIQSEIKDNLSKELSAKKVGIQIVNLSIQDAEPPTDEIVSAFKSVETAKQGKETNINNAKKYKNEQLPGAEAEADRIVKAAEAAKDARIAEAEGQVARFKEMYEQYKLTPDITKKRLFYETMEDILPDLKVIITDGKTQEMLPLESFSSDSSSLDKSSSGKKEDKNQKDGE